MPVTFLTGDCEEPEMKCADKNKNMMNRRPVTANSSTMFDTRSRTAE